MNVKNIIDGIESRSADSIKAEQGDYIVDGLLICGKCHTPKQIRVVILDQERTPMCLCKCEAERRDREAEQRKRAEFREQVTRMRRAGFSDAEVKKMETWTFENDDRSNEKVSRIARNYVEHFAEMKKAGKGLLFYGEVGRGKSFIAAAIVNALIDKGIPCLATKFSRLEKTISGMREGKQQYIDSLNNYALLFIDDLATERNTEYMSEFVFDIIDNRSRAGLPTLITTNLTAEELKNPAEVSKQRVYSRLLEMCLPVEVEGHDRRRDRLKADFKQYADMLGF